MRIIIGLGIKGDFKMFETLFQMETLHRIFLNTILVSIPEEFYLVMFTYILMGEFDSWKDENCKKLFYPWDYGRVFVPAVTAALVSNILRYTGVKMIIITAVSFLTVFVLIVLYGDILKNGAALIWIVKAFGFLLLAFLILIIIEVLYIPIVLYATGKEITEINNDIFLNFAISIPGKVIQYLILVYLVARKRTFLRANIFIPIQKNKMLSKLAIVMLLTNSILIYILGKTISYQRVLSNIPSGLRIVVILGICLFPILNISAFLSGIYYMENKQALKQNKLSKELYNIADEINKYTEIKDKSILNWKINEFSNSISNLSQEVNYKK